MNAKRIALYVVILLVAVFWWREPLVRAIQDRVESHRQALQERGAVAWAEWNLAFATKAADGNNPRQRIVAAQVLRGAREGESARKRDGQALLYTEAQLQAFESRADAIARELMAESDDELVLWLLAGHCQRHPDVCDQKVATQRLREVAGDNASVQLAALGLADDPATRRDALAAAARATRDSLYWIPAMDAFQSTLALVPMPAEVSKAQGVDDESLALLTLGFGFVMGMPMPPVQSTARNSCKAGSPALDDPAWRADCIAVARTLADTGDTLLNHAVGLNLLRGLLDGTDEENGIIERLREREWLMAQQRLIPASDFTDPAALAQWIADWRQGGEVYALREKLRRHELAPTPSAGWMAERPEALDP